MKQDETRASDEKGWFGYRGQRRPICEGNVREEESEPHSNLGKGIPGPHWSC